MRDSISPSVSEVHLSCKTHEESRVKANTHSTVAKMKTIAHTAAFDGVALWRYIAIINSAYQGAITVR